LSADSFS